MFRYMNIFEKSKSNEDHGKINCINCGKEFKPDKRNLNRGWGLSCSKSCSAKYKIKIKYLTDSERKVEERNKKISQLGIF